MPRKKFCRACGGSYPKSQFYRNPNTGDRLSTYCKPCCLKKHAESMSRYPTAYRSNETVPKIDLRPEGPQYHSCGNALMFGTNGFGYAVEYCGHCGTETLTPRGGLVGLRHA